MKKIYLTVGVALVSLMVNAQTTFKIANPLKTRTVISAERLIGGTNSTQAASATIVCNTQYTAGTTMNLNFTYTTLNTDLEYVDSLAITFPAGITPNSVTPSDSFPNTQDAGGGKEKFNGVAGQVISWGKTGTDQYGGIFSSTGIGFTVNVTIAPSITGNKSTTFFAQGDGFTAHANVNGSFVIYPVGAILKNLDVKFVQPLHLTALSVCNYGQDTLFALVKNLGNVADSTSQLTFSVNGTVVSSTSVGLLGPIAPGDSSFVFCLVPFNFSAQNVYSILAYVSDTSDIDMSNDTAKLAFTNSIPVALTSTVYTNGIESAYDYASLTRAVVASSPLNVGFGPSTLTFHAGAQALFYTIGNTGAGFPVGTYQAVAITPCVDVTAGETYRVSYWKRSNSVGQSAILTGTTNTAAAMTTVLKAYSAITPASTWIKDSVDYVATATETRYFAIGGKGTNSATVGVNVRVDDIKIMKLGLVDVKENTRATFVIYPNPNNGLFTVNTVNTAASIEVYNLVGEKIYTTTNVIKGINTVDLSIFVRGSYLVKVATANEIITKKITIQ